MPRVKLTAEEKKLRRNLRDDLDKLQAKYERAGMAEEEFLKVTGDKLGLHPSLNLFSFSEAKGDDAA
jgi:hypothetical protein